LLQRRAPAVRGVDGQQPRAAHISTWHEIFANDRVRRGTWSSVAKLVQTPTDLSTEKNGKKAGGRGTLLPGTVEAKPRQTESIHQRKFVITLAAAED
jgi:hypothetical protein